MLKSIKVAVTGSVSSGKSTVCKQLEHLGAFVVSADEIVHQLLSIGTPVGQKIHHLFGDGVMHNGELDRDLIAKRVFHDEKLLKDLEQLTHPEVLNKILHAFNGAERSGKFPLLVAEIPLLFEAGMEMAFDAVIFVTANAKIRHKRYRDSCPNDDFEARERRFLAPETKEKMSHFVINNDGSLEELQEKTTQIFHLLTKEDHPDESRRTTA